MLAQQIQRSFSTLNESNTEHEISKETLIQIVQHLTDQSQKRERELMGENERLRREQIELHEKNNRLEANYDDLVNEVEDLRNLVKRVYDEGEIQLNKSQCRSQLSEQKLENVSNAFNSLLSNLPSMTNDWAQLVCGEPIYKESQ